MGWGKGKLLEKKVEELKKIDEINEEGFIYEEAIEEDNNKIIFSIYGLKNDGKTAVAYGVFPKTDKVCVLSYDHKSTRPKKLPFLKDLNIKVFNAVKLLDKSSKELYLHTSEITYKYNLWLLEQIAEKEKPDWIIFDGTEILSTILEMVMRKRNNFLPYQGIGNLNVWKERKQYIDDIHNKALSIAKKGVIYTMYTEKDEIIKDGQVVRKKDVPKWIGSVMVETDIVIKVESEFESGKKVYKAIIEGSKLPDLFPEGIYNVTGKRLWEVLGNDD